MDLKRSLTNNEKLSFKMSLNKLLFNTYHLDIWASHNVSIKFDKTENFNVITLELSFINDEKTTNYFYFRYIGVDLVSYKQELLFNDGSSIYSSFDSIDLNHLLKVNEEIKNLYGGLQIS